MASYRHLGNSVPSPGPTFLLLHMPACKMLPHSFLSSRPGAGVLSREQFHLPGPRGCVLAFLAVAYDGQWGGMLLASSGRSRGSCLTSCEVQVSLPQPRVARPQSVASFEVEVP